MQWLTFLAAKEKALIGFRGVVRLFGIMPIYAINIAA
jgi:hypothetical protein